MLERRPEWRIPPPPFKGPHTEASKTKNRLSNSGKRRSPDFGPRIGQIMVEIWKREEYKKKRIGKKRGTPSRKTREKIARSLERKWRKDKKYRKRMLEIRNTPEWKARLQRNLDKIREERKPAREERISIDGKKQKILRLLQERDKLSKKELRLLKKAI